MKCHRLISAAVLSLTLGACLHPIPRGVSSSYVPSPPTPTPKPYAYTEIDPTTYTVSYYSDSSGATAMAGLLLTCEYLAGFKGFDYLVTLTEPQLQDSQSTAATTSTTGRTHGAAFGNGYGGAWGVGRYKGSSTTTTTTYDVFQASVTIRLMHGAMPADSTKAYPARTDAPSPTPTPDDGWSSEPPASPDIWR